jgi:hypothetical protein
MTNRKLSFVVGSFALAIGIVMAGMLMSAPVTMAVTNQGLDVARMAFNASTSPIKGIPEYSTL